MEGWAELAAIAQKGSVTRPEARGEEILPCGRPWDAALGLCAAALAGGLGAHAAVGTSVVAKRCSISLCSLADTESPWLPVSSPQPVALDPFRPWPAELELLGVRAALPKRRGSVGSRVPRAPSPWLCSPGRARHPRGARPPHAGRVQAVGCSGPEYFYPLRVCVSHSFLSLQY